MVTLPGCSPYEIDPEDLIKLYQEIKLKGYLNLACLSPDNSDRQLGYSKPYTLRSNLAPNTITPTAVTTTVTSTLTIPNATTNKNDNVNNFSGYSFNSNPLQRISEIISPESNRSGSNLTSKRQRENVYDFGNDHFHEQYKEQQSYKRPNHLHPNSQVKGSLKCVLENLENDNYNYKIAANTNSLQVISPRRQHDNASPNTIVTTEAEGNVSLDFMDSPSERDESSIKKQIDKVTNDLVDEY